MDRARMEGRGAPDFEHSKHHSQEINHHFRAGYNADKAGDKDKAKLHNEAAQHHNSAFRAYRDAGEHEGHNEPVKAAGKRQEGAEHALLAKPHAKTHGGSSGSVTPSPVPCDTPAHDRPALGESDQAAARAERAAAPRLARHLHKDGPWGDSRQGLSNAACGPPNPATA